MNFRFVIFPLIMGHKNAIADSGFFVAWGAATRLADRGWHVYVVVPDSFMEYADKLGYPGVTVLYGGVSTEYYALHTTYLDTRVLVENFSPVMGKYRVDGALVFSGEHVIPVRGLLNDNSDEPQVPVYLYSHGATSVDTDNGFSEDVTKYTAQAFGFTQCTLLVPTHREFSVLYDMALKYGVGAVLREKMQNDYLLASPPMDWETLKAIKVAKGDTQRLLFAARFNSVKGVEKIVAAYDLAYKMGLDVEVSVLTNTPEHKAHRYADTSGLFAERGYISPKYAATREDFYQEAAKSHIYVMWSTSEAMPVGLMEAVMLGCLPMVYKSVWAQQVFSAWAEHPLWFSNKKELVGLIAYYQRNPGERDELVTTLKKDLIASWRGMGLDDVIDTHMEQHYSAIKDTRGMLGYETALVAMLQAVSGKVLDTKKEAKILASRVSKGIIPFLRVPRMMPDMTRWAGHRYMTDYGAYRMMKFVLRIPDDTTKTRVVFRIDEATAKRLDAYERAV